MRKGTVALFLCASVLGMLQGYPASAQSGGCLKAEKHRTNPSEIHWYLGNTCPLDLVVSYCYVHSDDSGFGSCRQGKARTVFNKERKLGTAWVNAVKSKEDAMEITQQRIAAEEKQLREGYQPQDEIRASIAWLKSSPYIYLPLKSGQRFMDYIQPETATSRSELFFDSCRLDNVASGKCVPDVYGVWKKAGSPTVPSP